MMFVNINSVCMFLAASAVNFALANADCQSEYTAFFSSDCVGTADDMACPSTCTDYLTSLHESCEDGGTILNEDNETELYTVNKLLGLGMFVSDSCEESMQTVFLTASEDSTCSTLVETNSFASFFVCNGSDDNGDDDECPDFCKEVIDKMYLTCASTDTVGEDKTSITYHATSLGSFRSDACNAYAADKTFSDGIGLSISDCVSGYSNFYFQSDCTMTDEDTCPSTCTDYITNVHESCEGEALPGGEGEIYAIQNLLALDLLTSETCKGPVQDTFLTISEGATCNDIVSSNSYAAIFLCADDPSEAECPEFCTALIDKMYSTCASTDRVGEDDSESSAQATAYALSLFRSDACNDYADNKSFQGISTSDPTNSDQCNLCTGFDENLMLDLSFLAPTSVAGVPAGNRFLQDANVLDSISTCGDLKIAISFSEDPEACDMASLIAYANCGCTDEPPVGSCYTCPDGDAIDKDMVPDIPDNMIDDESGFPSGTCGELAIATSFASIMMGELEDAFEGDVSQTSSSSGDMTLGEIDICGLVHSFCGCKGLDTCKICENGLDNPDHIVEGEGFTCEEGVEMIERTGSIAVGDGTLCDESKMTAKEAGCRCKSPASTNRNIAMLLVVSAATTMVAFLA